MIIVQIIGGPKDGQEMAFPDGAHIPQIYLMPEPIAVNYLNNADLTDAPAIRVREYNLMRMTHFDLKGVPNYAYVIGKICEY